MKANTYYAVFSLFVVLNFMCFSCSPLEKEVIIDNPGDEKISIQFQDGKYVEIEADTTIITTVKFGKQVIIINGVQIEEVQLEDDYEYLINPGRLTYYLQTITYFRNLRARENYYENHQPVRTKVGAFELEGEYLEIKEQLLIKKNWDFGLYDTPSTQGNIQTMRDYYHAKKIHREKDLFEEIGNEFIEYLEEELEKSD